VPFVGIGGGVLDAAGGGGWGPIVTLTLIGRGHVPRKVIGSNKPYRVLGDGRDLRHLHSRAWLGRPRRHYGADAKDLEFSLRFKPISGKVEQAGAIAVRLTSPDDYYVVRANALENNVRFYRGSKVSGSSSRERV
jgi:hypothetical protein